MAKIWSQFLQQQAEGQNSSMPPWRNAAGPDCINSQATSAQLPQNQFIKRNGLNSHALCNDGVHGRDFAALSGVAQVGSSAANLMCGQLVNGDILPAPQNVNDYQRRNQASPAQLSQAQQLSVSQAIDNRPRRSILDIMDSLPLEPQLKGVSPLSVSSSCGHTRAMSTHGGIASMTGNSSCQSPGGSAKYNNINVTGTMTTKNPTSNGIDRNSKLAASYNDILSCTPTSQNHPSVGTDHKLAASYNDVVLGIGPSQNHALAGLDHKLAAGYNDILLGAGISQNHVSAGANCNGYNDIPSVPDSKLASSWLASGGSQDLSPEEKEMIYRAAAMQPIDMNPLGSTSRDTEVDRPKPRRNVRISKDPQSIAARQRRQRISSKMRVLQKLVPGGMKMDTASMLDEAAQYLKFLKAEVDKMEAIEQLINVAKGQLDCRLAQGASLNACHSMKPKNNLSQSGPQASLLCNPPSSQYPQYLNQASLTF